MACGAASASPSRGSLESGPFPATLSLGHWYVTLAYTPGPASVVYGFIRSVSFCATPSIRWKDGLNFPKPTEPQCPTSNQSPMGSSRAGVDSARMSHARNNEIKDSTSWMLRLIHHTRGDIGVRCSLARCSTMQIYAAAFASVFCCWLINITSLVSSMVTSRCSARCVEKHLLWKTSSFRTGNTLCTRWESIRRIFFNKSTCHCMVVTSTHSSIPDIVT